MRDFERLIEQAQAMGLRSLISPSNLHELQLEIPDEKHCIRYLPRSASHNSVEINYYGWRLKRSQSKKSIDIEFISTQPLSITASCSCNDPGEFNIDILTNSKRGGYKSAVACPFDVSCFNVGHLLPVDWGIINLYNSLIVRVWPVKSDSIFLFAIFGIAESPDHLEMLARPFQKENRHE